MDMGKNNIGILVHLDVLFNKQLTVHPHRTLLSIFLLILLVGLLTYLFVVPFGAGIISDLFENVLRIR